LSQPGRASRNGKRAEDQTRGRESLERSAAFGVVEPLSVLVRWARLRFYERIADLADVHLDRSTISILDVVGRMGPLRMSTVADAIGLDRSTVSRLVATRIEDGYLQRTGDASDARASIISLTDKGKTARQKLSRAWQSIAVGLVVDWSEEDQLQAARLLKALSDKIRGDNGF
jgi:DNA-binding MarR family transcriptional regulator